MKRNQAEGLLFSGGLDSALVAAQAKDCRAISVGLESYGEDGYYADTVAKLLKLEYYHKTVKIEEAIATIPEVIRILRSFDPAIPNDVTVYLGLRYAKGLGIGSMMTGDGGDELFAGYDFMLKMKDLEQYMSRMHSTMQFSSNKIGEALGIHIKQPFLDKDFVEFSQGINLDLKIRREDEKTWGKWMLRKAFEGVLPEEILWQSKRPLEYGSGMTEMRKIVAAKVSDEEFEEERRKSPIKFWNKEHFYYYRIYSQVVGEIPAPERGQKTCECCGAGMDQRAFHCRVCGGVTEWRRT
ncbi:MAG: asparagine synthase C-terminal domain-containing protein [Desulfobacterales bacterium]|nr:asparagine synthase C-terminal domain-containing protein [Desulfobacterales bacterium]